MAGSYASRGRFNRPREIPPLREDPFTPDDYDADRCAMVKSLWESQDDALRQRDRQVEENIRMLAGQHWIVWSDMRGRFMNLAEMLDDDERRWRHMPVLNRLFLWFILQHARMNENPPVISWLPGPDRIDAMLAEVMDPVHKYIWRETGMLEVLDRLFAWLIPGGRAFLKSRIDPMKGDPIVAQGPAMLQLLGPDGQPIPGPDGNPIQRAVDSVPFRRGESGLYEPAARLVETEDGDYDVDMLGEPEVFYEGGIAVDVLSCLEVRGEWGPRPWHEKAWHIHKTYMTPLQAYETFGIELEPDTRGEAAENVGTFMRILHGSGLFGANEGRSTFESAPMGEQEFVSVYEAWFAPSRLRGMQRTHDSPGGRLCTVTGGGTVIRDGVRTAPFRYTSPIRCFDYVNIPGRPQGSSPQEQLNGPVRTRNRLYAQGLAHATLVANPVRIINRDAGIEEGQIKNLPGEEVVASLRNAGTQPPLQYAQPPALDRSVWESADRLGSEVDQIGSIAGTEGTPPTQDASGELVKELRFNADRPIAATMRRAVIELGRLAEDWIALIPTIWDQEKIISIVGEDGIARTVTVWPELFSEGSVNVEPHIESMLPESRGERQQRALAFYERGLYGQPGSTEAINAFLDEARFPHMSRLVRPGGVDRAMAEQNVGKLLKGVPAAEIPIFPWYDHAIHRFVLERFMKAPEYLKLDVQTQQEFVTYRALLMQAQSETAVLEAHREVGVQAAAAEPALALQARADESAMRSRAAAQRPDGFATPPDRGPTGELPRTHASVA